jgi:hypothetical protein
VQLRHCRYQQSWIQWEQRADGMWLAKSAYKKKISQSQRSWVRAAWWSGVVDTCRRQRKYVVDTRWWVQTWKLVSWITGSESINSMSGFDCNSKLKRSSAVDIWDHLESTQPKRASPNVCVDHICSCSSLLAFCVFMFVSSSCVRAMWSLSVGNSSNFSFILI